MYVSCSVLLYSEVEQVLKGSPRTELSHFEDKLSLCLYHGFFIGSEENVVLKNISTLLSLMALVYYALFCPEMLNRTLCVAYAKPQGSPDHGY